MHWRIHDVMVGTFPLPTTDVALSELAPRGEGMPFSAKLRAIISRFWLEWLRCLGFLRLRLLERPRPAPLLKNLPDDVQDGEE
jgi:hypothetical protein